MLQLNLINTTIQAGTKIATVDKIPSGSNFGVYIGTSTSVAPAFYINSAGNIICKNYFVEPTGGAVLLFNYISIN